MEFIQISSPRLLRSADGIIGGVCSGLAKPFEIESGILRILFIGSTLLFGTGVGFYILLWIALPREDRAAKAYDSRVFGVCASLAKKLNMEVGLVRFLALISIFVSLGTTVIIYVLLYFILPSAKTLSEGHHQSAPSGVRET